MKKIKIAIIIIACGIFLCSCSAEKGPAGPAGDPGSSLLVMNFQDGVYPSASYSGTSDSYIDSGVPAVNFGSSEDLYDGYNGASAGPQRSLIKFDLSLLSSQSLIVKKAYLTMYVDQRSTVSDFTITPHKVLKSWDESLVAWNASAPWAADGGDFDAKAAGKAVTMDAVNVMKTFELDAAVVQAWLDKPAANYGLILVADSEAGGFNSWVSFLSRNYTVAAGIRPRLTVYYTED